LNKVGVTGAAGFIGSHLVKRLLGEGVEVVGVDDLSYGSMANLSDVLSHPRFTFHRLDCTRRRPLRAAFDGCDSIAHLAAKKIPRFGGTLSTLEVNVGGVNSACAVALSLDADIIITSTSDVYGMSEPPFSEDSLLTIGPPTTKRWAYAVSKMYDEHVALALAEEKGLRTTILRLFNAYGPNNHLTWWGGPTVTFIEALLDGETMEIHGDGLQTRTFTYVSDTVDGFVRALRTPESRGEVINVGGTETLTIRQLADRIQAKLGIAGPLRARDLPYDALPGKYQDVLRRVPDTSKAERLLGFKAQVSVDEGLDETIAWHRAQREAVAAGAR
jgi:nucleoside-diphosphate-sugar epimerase